MGGIEEWQYVFFYNIINVDFGRLINKLFPKLKLTNFNLCGSFPNGVPLQ